MANLSDLIITRNASSPTDDVYAAWVSNPTPENMKAVLDDLDPTINAEVQRFSGPKPLLRSRARSLAVKAIRSYNPDSGTRLRSWVVTQLQPLSRYNNSLKPIHLPEDVSRKAYAISKATDTFLNENGRYPTDDELADEIGVSVPRLKKIRSMSAATVNEPTESDADDETTPDYAVYRSNPAQAASSMVYAGLDKRDKAIFDLRTGMHGKKTMSGVDVASLLRVSPAFVTQRSNAIANRILDVAKGVE